MGSGPDDVGNSGRGEATWRVVYTLLGDGVARWTATMSGQLRTGQYTVPSWGSGSGFAIVSVESDPGFSDPYSPPHWSVSALVQTGRMPVRTNLTAKNRWVWDNHILTPIYEEWNRALGGPPPDFTEVVTYDEQGQVPSADANWDASEDATSHSGSHTETSGGALLAGLLEAKSTKTTTWNLRKVPVPARPPSVRIYGQPCGCIEPDETQTSMSFIAAGEPAGGTFSEFIVKTDGTPPEILSNSGDYEPRLTIAGTKDTGTVFLSVRYTRAGRTIESEPFKVEFCAIEDIELADGDEHDLSFDAADKLTVEARAKAWRGGRDISPSLVWELEPMGAPTSLQATPASKKGDQIEFVYSGLPENNTDFGPKRLTARVDGCDCEREETIRTFFPLQNLDDAEDAFKYWKQTTAAPGDARPLMTFVRVIPSRHEGDSVAGRWDFPTQNLLVGAVAFLKGGCRGRRRASDVPGVGMPLGARAEGIDCFAETVRHEMQHRADAIEWWGSPRGSLAVSIGEALWRDPDIDFVPSEVEKARRNCLWRPTQGIDALDIDPGRAQYSCFDRPFRDVSDLEINAYWTGWTWPIGSVDYEDWSCGSVSKQWKGKRCGS